MAIWAKRSARCVGCDYPLYRLSGPKCPECGRPFDPTDPTSFRDDRLGQIKWFFSAPRSWGALAISLATIAYIVDRSLPWAALLGRTGFAYVSVCGIITVAILACVVDYLVRILTAFLKYVQPVGSPRKDVRRTHVALAWLVVPCCVLLLSVDACYDVAFRVRYSLSSEILLGTAQAAIHENAPPTPCWVGLFRVEEIAVERNGVRFQVGVGPGGGRVYLTYNLKPVHDYMSYRPIEEDVNLEYWWWFE